MGGFIAVAMVLLQGTHYPLAVIVIAVRFSCRGTEGAGRCNLAVKVIRQVGALNYIVIADDQRVF